MVMYSTVATIGIQCAVRRESQWLVCELCCRSLKTAEGSLTPYLKRGACTRSHHGYGNQGTVNLLAHYFHFGLISKRGACVIQERSSVDEDRSLGSMWVLNPKAEWSDVGYVVALTERKTLTCKRSSWLRECEARGVRFAPVASALEAMVQESVTDGNPESRCR